MLNFFTSRFYSQAYIFISHVVKHIMVGATLGWWKRVERVLKMIKPPHQPYIPPRIARPVFFVAFSPCSVVFRQGNHNSCSENQSIFTNECMQSLKVKWKRCVLDVCSGYCMVCVLDSSVCSMCAACMSWQSRVMVTTNRARATNNYAAHVYVATTFVNIITYSCVQIQTHLLWFVGFASEKS